MASPVVAGAAALLLQARPDLNPDQVKALLTSNVNATADRRGRARHLRGADAPRSAPAPTRASSPNPTVAAALVEAGIDPTRATWTQGHVDPATWTKATWTKATWTKATWTGGVAAPWATATWTCDLRRACDGDASRPSRLEQIDLEQVHLEQVHLEPQHVVEHSNGDLRPRHLGRQAAPAKQHPARAALGRSRRVNRLDDVASMRPQRPITEAMGIAR